jgi:hypothetical protein
MKMQKIFDDEILEDLMDDKEDEQEIDFKDH